MSEIETFENHRTSPFVERSISCIVHISPEYLHDINTGVRKYLNFLVMKSLTNSSKFISYSNLQIDDKAYIFDANTLIHVKISFDAIIYEPRVGDVYDATVKHLNQFSAHFTLFGIFGATADIDETWSFEEGEERKWVSEDMTLEANDNLKYEVVSIKNGRIFGKFYDIQKAVLTEVAPQREDDTFGRLPEVDEE